MKSVQIWSFFWSLFSCIWTEYGDLRSQSSYSFQIQENKDQKKLCIWKIFTQWLLFDKSVIVINKCNHSKVFRKISFTRILWYTQVNTLGKVWNLFSFSGFCMFVFEETLKFCRIVVSNAYLRPWKTSVMDLFHENS